VAYDIKYLLSITGSMYSYKLW